MRKKIKVADKKPHRLPLASMSEHYKEGKMPKKSGKHHSQEMQEINARNRNRIKKNKKKGINPLTNK